VWCLVLAFVIGKRDQASADLLLARVAYVTDDYIPFFTSDQLPEYEHALLTTYGEWYQPERHGTRGTHPKPRRRPLPGLLYAQVIKKRLKGRVVEVGTHVVFGTQDAVAAQTSPTHPFHQCGINWILGHAVPSSMLCGRVRRAIIAGRATAAAPDAASA
jgi:hypothetical protein